MKPAKGKLITPIILAGGKGTRLWPLSRAACPKQFLPLMNDQSPFQQTLQRLNDPERYLAPIVITNHNYRFLVAEQALECGIELNSILLEPVARNTAAAIAAACIVATADGSDRLVHILPSDHDIKIDDAYCRALDTATTTANGGWLTTFGITPTEPETGYGYIKAGKELVNGAHAVKRFVEKPNPKRAEKMLSSSNYYWNSGMFLFSAKTFLSECEALAPDVFNAATAAVSCARNDLDFLRLDEASFAKAPDISIDYAVFEQTKRAAVVPAPIVWSDLGAWDAVWKSGEKDTEGNLSWGTASLNNTSDSLIVSEKVHVIVDSLKDIAVITSEDAVYVGHLSAAQNVGQIVKQLRAHSETIALTESHQTNYRPWGGYSQIFNGDRFQVKRLFVKPGKRLSLQKHYHRAEHWTVVSGTAEVQVDTATTILMENESTYIPQGALHRLHNPGKIQLELIEVQTGSYLGEDDIIRFEDEYGRI